MFSILLYYRKGNGQIYPESLFLNASINFEIIFLQIGYRHFPGKMGHFHFTGSNRAVVLTGARGRIELPQG